MKYLFITTALFFSLIMTSASAQNESAAEVILQQRHKEIYANRALLVKQDHDCAESLKTHTGTEDHIRLYNEIARLNNLITKSREEELQMDFEFIRNNPSSSQSINLIYYRVVNREYTNSYDTFYHYYSLLSDGLKNSDKGKTLSEEFINWKNSLIGSYAKDFSAKDIDKNEVTLSSYKGNSYVLLDFWGVHCGPCRHGMPYLKELYGKYHKKGLEIIGISPDYDIDNWRQAIKQDGTDIWRQVSQKQNNADIFKEFYAKAMPMKILINKEGLIINVV